MDSILKNALRIQLLPTHSNQQDMIKIRLPFFFDVNFDMIMPSNLCHPLIKPVTRNWFFTNPQ